MKLSSLVLILASISLFACSTTTVHQNESAKTEEAAKSPEKPAEAQKEASTKVETAEVKKEEAPAPQPQAAPTPQEIAASTPAPAATPAEAHPSAHAREAGPVPADKALGWLKNGNVRFIKGKLRKDGQSKADIARLAKGQKPHSIVLSCSDSRVPPEVIFDQKLGEIFVVRTAGETLDSSAIASIEYAVEHLGSNHILVLGHESCGAVKAAFATLEGADAGSPWLNKLVADIHPRIMSFKGKALSEGAIEEGWANVKGVAADLLSRSDLIRAAVQSGEVKITRALYHLNDGHVEWGD